MRQKPRTDGRSDHHRAGGSAGGHANCIRLWLSNANSRTWYHGTIYVNAPDGQYQCSVDVATQSTIRVQYQVLHKLPVDLFAPILTLQDGYHDLAFPTGY